MSALATDDRNATDVTPRQQAVLDAALGVLVEQGDRLTMTAVARRASCSKETLYKWFGDRDGLLTATVRWQAAKVRGPAVDLARIDADGLRLALEDFAIDLLTVLSGQTSVALNRAAISHAGSDKPGLGTIVLENGRFAMGRLMRPVLEAARARELLAFDDAEECFRFYFGLVVRDLQVRLLLGDRSLATDAAALAAEARRATTQFLRLYGAGEISS